MGLGSFMNNISMPSFSAAGLGGGNLTGGAVPFANHPNGGGVSQGGNFGSCSGGGSNNFSGGGNGNFSSGGPGGSFQRN